MNLNELEDFQQREFKNDYRLRGLLGLIPKSRGKILDIGCGNGEIAIFLSKQAKIVYAIDKSEVLLKRLKEKAKKIPNLKTKKIDAENFSLKEKSFDLITACDVVEHLKNDSFFFRKCYQHLAQRGQVFVSAPAHPFLYGIKDRALGHCRRYRREKLKQKIGQAGFEIISCRYWNLIGFLPYYISERIFKKGLTGPARHQANTLLERFINNFLYFWLSLEGKIKCLPFGLSLIILAQKNESKKV